MHPKTIGFSELELKYNIIMVLFKNGNASKKESSLVEFPNLCTAPI